MAPFACGHCTGHQFYANVVSQTLGGVTRQEWKSLPGLFK